MKWQDPIIPGIEVEYDVLDDLNCISAGTYILQGSNGGEIEVVPWNKGEPIRIVRINNEMAESKIQSEQTEGSGEGPI